MTIGENIHTLRKAKGLSQEELAEKLGVQRQTISKWELGQSVPDLEYILMLCEIFSVSADFLIKGENPHAAPLEPVKASAETKKSLSTKTLLAIIMTVFGVGGVFTFSILEALNPIGVNCHFFDLQGTLLSYLAAENRLFVFLLCLSSAAFGVSTLTLDIIKTPDKISFKGVELRFSKAVFYAVSLVLGVIGHIMGLITFKMLYLDSYVSLLFAFILIALPVWGILKAVKSARNSGK